MKTWIQSLIKRHKPAATPSSNVETDTMLQPLIRPEARTRWLSSGLRRWTPTMVETCFREALSGNLARQWQLFDLMEETWPRLQKNLCELKDAVTALDWSVHPCTPHGGTPSPEAQRKAAFAEHCLHTMRPEPDRDEFGFEDTLWNLLDARGKGIAVLEVDWECRSAGNEPCPERSLCLAPRATRLVHPLFYGYPPQGEDRLMLNADALGFSGDSWMPFPQGKFLIGVCKSKSGHPVSAGLLRTLGFWWAAANFSREWFLNFAQLFGQPMRWATYDPNISESDRAILESMLANMGSAAWAMFPAGTGLELKEPAHSASDNPQMALLNFADRLCDLVVLRQTLTSDVRDGSGNRALGEVHERVLTGVKQSLAAWACRVLNRQLIRPLIQLNFGNEQECPVLTAALREQRDRKSTAEGLLAARRAGLRIPTAWAYQQLDIPQPGPGDDTLHPGSASPALPEFLNN